jgi:hypothetical protein
MIGTKQDRPVKVCSVCKKEKPIVKHLDGNPDEPLCAACNMALRRASASNDLALAIRLAAAINGTMERLLRLDLEAGQEHAILDMQTGIKILLRAWLGEVDDNDKSAPSEAKRSPGISADHDGKSSSQGRSGLTQAERNKRISDGQKARYARMRAQREAEQ